MNHDDPTPPPAGLENPATRADDDVLDEVLAGARWPEPSADSQRRLREAWQSLSRRRPFLIRHRRWLGTAGAAAAVVALSALMVRHLNHPGGNAGDGLTAQRPVEDPTPTAPVQDLPPAPSAEPARYAMWRPPTPWEAVLVRPRRENRSESTSRPAAVRPPTFARPDSLVGRVESALETTTAGGEAPDAAVVAAGLRKDFSDARIEQWLTPVILRRGDPRRRAAVRLLAEVATPRSAPLLASLAAEPDVHADALAGLVRVGDVPTLAALAAEAADDDELRRLIAAMLRRDPARAVPAYLAFVSDKATATAALAALDDVPNPPVDVLFDRLNDPRRATRLAAARTLGRIDGPIVTARLAAMVRLNVNRHEALAALASSEGPEAKAFFEWASASKEFGAAARTALTGLNQL